MSRGGLLYLFLLIVFYNDVHSIATEKRHFKFYLVSKAEI